MTETPNVTVTNPAESSAPERVFYVSLRIGADAKATNKVATVLAAAHLQVINVERPNPGIPSTRLGFATEIDCRNVEQILKRAGFDATVPADSN